MYLAKERRTGRIVSADEAMPYGSYRCPTCNADVFLRSGRYRVTHFAHMPGQGKPECEFFHQTDDLRHQWQSNVYDPQGPTIDPLRLSIELEPDTDAHRGPRKWGLRLTVPKSHDPHGDVSIDLGSGDVRKISLAGLSLGARTYRADLATSDFGAAWVSPEVRPAYRAAVVHRILGLSRRFVTAFAAVEHKLKPQCKIVRWGESYYFVWNSNMSVLIPSSLPHHSFAENQGWSCSLLALPDMADPEVAAWLERICDLQIARSKREWALIFPTPYAVDDDGKVEIHSTSRLLLAIKPIGEEGEDGGEIACLSGRHSAALQLTGSHRHFVEITVPDQTPPRAVHLTWDGTPLDSLTAKAYPQSPAEPAVAIEFIVGVSKTSTFLHRASCAAALAHVRAGKYRLAAVSGFADVRGHLRSRRTGQFAWESHELHFAANGLPTPDGNITLAPEHVDRITSFLQDLSRDVALDFGPFGSFSALAAPEIAARTTAFRMDRGLRSRVEWLCKVSGALVNAQRRPVGALDDAALLRHLSSFSVPASLMAHLQALERDLLKRGEVPRP
jgi:hypothetical protein